MKKRLLTGVLPAGLVLSMATPAFATTQFNTETIEFSQKGRRCRHFDCDN